MTFTDVGRQYVAFRLGSAVPTFIGHIGIGIGSTAADFSDVTLENERNRVAITGSPNFTESRKVTFQADLNSVQMSGTELAEFGLFDVASGTGFQGSAWQREAFDPITFDGSNELQITTSIEVLRSGL